MNRRMLFVSLLGGLVLAPTLVFGTPPPAQAQATSFTSSQDVPIPSDLASQPNSCTDPVDTVMLTGTVHTLTHISTLPDGSSLIDLESNFQNVIGVGTPSGLTYHATAADHTTFSTPGPVTEFTMTQSSLLITSGGVSNSVLHMVFHGTVSTDGTVSVTVSNVQITCQ
jgi:hypothetical protein